MSRWPHVLLTCATSHENIKESLPAILFTFQTFYFFSYQLSFAPMKVPFNINALKNIFFTILPTGTQQAWAHGEPKNFTFYKLLFLVTQNNSFFFYRFTEV